MQDNSPDTPPEPDEHVLLLADMTNGYTLMAQHGEDDHGRCASCRGGGDATGHELWPCYLYRLGQQVAALQWRRRDE